MDDRCLIVVNNFEGSDIHPTIEFPVIFRQFNIAFGRVDYYHLIHRQRKSEAGTLWIPKQNVSKINGNYSVATPNQHLFSVINSECLILQYVYSFWPPDTNSQHCSPPNAFNFILTSRPWQCEIQVDLFMPDELLRLGKYTTAFNTLTKLRLKSVPSLRPPVHILIDTKTSVEEYDWAALASCTLKSTTGLGRISEVKIVNSQQLTGHVFCNAHFQRTRVNVECNIVNWNVIFPCPDCDKFVNANLVKLNYLSFDYIANLDKSQQNVAFPGYISHDITAMLKLGAIITTYVNSQAEEIKLPLQSLRRLKLMHSDKRQMLGFAYASLYGSFMGNLTSILGKSESPDVPNFKSNLVRWASIEDLEYREYNTALNVKNVFGKLHFVSCGSRRSHLSNLYRFSRERFGFLCCCPSHFCLWLLLSCTAMETG